MQHIDASVDSEKLDQIGATNRIMVDVICVGMDLEVSLIIFWPQYSVHNFNALRKPSGHGDKLMNGIKSFLVQRALTDIIVIVEGVSVCVLYCPLFSGI